LENINIVLGKSEARFIEEEVREKAVFFHA
jgi:hypothetical protein